MILKAYIETYIASLPSTEEREEYVLPTFKRELSEERLVVYKGLEDKATLVMNFSEEAKNKELEVNAMKIFGQLYKTRLRNKIREEKGGVYSIKANMKHSPRPYPKYNASISFSCAPKNIDALEKESLLVLKELLKEGPTRKEIASIKENWILSRKKAAEGNSYWFNYMYNKVYWKKPFKEISDYEKKLAEITPKLVKKIANKYINKPSLIAKLLPEEKEETLQINE